ncbi:hypothetical protein XELAEV_18014065mg [Xenopus laevis]|uniref:Uncharacterized protein n=1 Tax=Xenopus laevis TaxID=8355 RepID=A0A974DQZ2_XENLA|nr:hypothetical protein XELAEV_18014065mg [Xenopus laevis]
MKFSLIWFSLVSCTTEIRISGAVMKTVGPFPLAFSVGSGLIIFISAGATLVTTKSFFFLSSLEMMGMVGLGLSFGIHGWSPWRGMGQERKSFLY